MSAKPERQLNQAKLEAFLGRVVADLGAALSANLTLIGDRLGLFREMERSGPVTSEELARRTEMSERYIREWLLNQAASGYIEYDPASKKYTLPIEHAAALADEESPHFVAAGFQVAGAMARAVDRIAENFRSGQGMGWGEHHPDLFHGTERFFRPSYVGSLVDTWLPALDGVVLKLQQGGVAADIGCGHGASTILMATAFPDSTFYGFDCHPPSIECARIAAREAGVADHCHFEVATSADFPDHRYDLVAFFDCLHDMGDPDAACKRAMETMKPDGTVMIVEPMAGKTSEENFNPVGRVYTAASVLCCTPNAISSGPIALGTVASDEELRKVANAGGLTRFRRATETPFNRIFEAKQ
jgi:2-polyprenyl-3-methyl-5-hydroxy-6-metoxy-1,4-benzoquinol methylase